MEIAHLSKMHCLFTIVFSFSATLESEVKPRPPQLYPVLKRLCDLFGTHLVVISLFPLFSFFFALLLTMVV